MRWHLSGGIAHPHGDGSAWCRIPHAVLCPARPPACWTSPQLEAVRRQLADRARRLVDTGTFTPAPHPAHTQSRADTGLPIRPVVQILLVRYLALSPIDTIRCVAQTCHRNRCTHPVLTPTCPAGIWRLLPTTAQHGQLALPDTLMAAYDLGHLPYSEQLRWRTQRCPAHAAADLTPAGWRPFDPLLHAEHIRTCLPRTPTRTPRHR